MEKIFEKLSLNEEVVEPEEDPLTYLLNAVKSIEISSFKLMINSIEFDVGTDSKLVSKIIEIYVSDFLTKKCIASPLKSMKCVVNPCQNSYPDCIVYIGDDAYALDIKTTYLVSKTKINGFTLGTYKGYFRDRKSKKNCMIPYENFKMHLCVCVIYERTDNGIVVKHTIPVEKWKLASRKRGSGNTTNIGSITDLQDILQAKPHFTDEDEFNAYWKSFS